MKPEAFDAFSLQNFDHKKGHLNLDELIHRYRAPLEPGSSYPSYPLFLLLILVTSESDLLKHEDGIRKCFSESITSVEDIVIALQKQPSEWAKNTAALLQKMSPTSLKVVFRQLHEGKKKNLAECFKMELRMAQAFMVTYKNDPTRKG